MWHLGWGTCRSFQSASLKLNCLFRSAKPFMENKIMICWIWLQFHTLERLEILGLTCSETLLSSDKPVPFTILPTISDLISRWDYDNSEEEKKIPNGNLRSCGAALAMIWSGSPGRRRPWVTVMYGRRETTCLQVKVIAGGGYFLFFNIYMDIYIAIQYLHPEWSNGVYGVAAPWVEALQFWDDACRP